MMTGFITTWEGRVLVITGIGIIIGSLMLFTIPSKPTTPKHQPSMSLTISSPTFIMNGTIPARFTCDGKDISPELVFSNIPTGTQSLALIMDDPDAPRGVWDHWVVWNMPPTTTGVKENSVPPGRVGRNSSGDMAYGGPCPPDREHRYIFTLYALDSVLALPQGSTKQELLQALAPHIIEKAQLVGRYDRN